MVTTTPVYVTPIPQTPVYTYTAPTPTPTPYLEAPFSTQAVPATIKMEARKIVITQLPHSASYYDLEKLLFKYITRAMSKSSPNGPHKELEELSIETRLNKKPRGHAFAILGSEQLARSVAKNLDGVQFRGRILKARLAKEGVKTRPDPAAEPHLMSPPLAYQPQDPPAAQPSPSHIEQVSAVENSSARTMSTTAPRIDSKSTWKTKEGSSERKKKSSSPAVVNGSSSGSSRERDEKSRKYRGFEW
jgi:RNA recognition motif-containing protein